MLISDLLKEGLSDKTLNALDSFLATSNETLSPTACQELQNEFGPFKNKTLYRVLGITKNTAHRLGMVELNIGETGRHDADRVTSWTTTLESATTLGTELEEPYVVVKAQIGADNIVLDTTILTNSQLASLRGNDAMLISIVRRQQEVIVAPGEYQVEVVELQN